jgi:C_GCAxxG_C_C family probable redox protein
MRARIENAVARFKAGCNCSQAVVTAYGDLFGLDEPTAMRASCGLGAGLGRLRETCGAVSGMAVLAGLKFGNTEPADAGGKKRTYEAVQQMAALFRERHGSLVCRTLLGLDQAEGDPTPSARTAAYYAKRPCAEYVATAAEIVERVLR